MTPEVFITQAKATLKTARDMQREVYYLQLLDLVAAVDARLRRGCHLRAASGALITTLDQWLLAAERGEWTADRQPATTAAEEISKRLAALKPAPPQYVRLTRPCASRIFKRYLPAGSTGRVIGRVNGKLNILFGRTLAQIEEDSSLIEAVK